MVGSVPKFADDPLRYLVGVQEAYGGQYPLVRLEPAGNRALNVVLDAELVHEVLADRERYTRPALGAEAQRREGLLSSRGPLWERQRSVLQPEFVGSRLADYADITGEVVDDLLAEWPANGEVDLLAELSVLTMRVIARTLFSMDASREQAREVHDALGTLADEFDLSTGSLLLPDALQSGPSPELDRARARLDAVATEFVEWHREQADPPRDVITALLEAEADPETALSDNELVDETVLFLTAGQETTALTIAYALYWLSQQPEARERVRREAETVLDGATPGWGDLPELAHTERVVRETLRLTPAAWNLTRETRGPTRLGDTRLEAGELVLMPTYAHHRDPRAWQAPKRFDPDRWDGRASRSKDAYFPFGSGPRVCIGRQVALTEAQFALTHLLQHYEIEVLADDLALEPGVTLRPAEEVRARVTRRD